MRLSPDNRDVAVRSYAGPRWAMSRVASCWNSPALCWSAGDDCSSRRIDSAISSWRDRAAGRLAGGTSASRGAPASGVAGADGTAGDRLGVPAVVSASGRAPGVGWLEHAWTRQAAATSAATGLTRMLQSYPGTEQAGKMPRGQ